MISATSLQSVFLVGFDRAKGPHQLAVGRTIIGGHGSSSPLIAGTTVTVTVKFVGIPGASKSIQVLTSFEYPD